MTAVLACWPCDTDTVVPGGQGLATEFRRPTAYLTRSVASARRAFE
jgi:hypothetical protein